MRMIKPLLRGLLLLAVVVLGAAALFLATFDPNDHKDTLIARVKAATGRDLTLEGPIELAFWPQLRLHLGALSLSDAPGFGVAPMVELEALEVAVATLPLLRGRIEMDTVKLTGATLNLARNAEGLTNWDDLRPKGGDSRDDDHGRLGALILGGVDITDAKLTWRDQAAQREIVMSALQAQSGPLTFDEPVHLSLSAKVESTKPALAGELALKSTATYDTTGNRYGIDPLQFTALLRGKTLPGGKADIVGQAVLALDLAAGEAQISALSIAGLGHHAAGEITLDHLNTERVGARGIFELSGKDLGVLLRAFALPAAPQVAAMRDRSFEFKIVFDRDVASGKLAVPTFEAKILGATLTGELRGERANTDTPALNGKLSAQGADLPALILLANQFMNGDTHSAPGLTKALASVKERAFRLDTEFTADLAAGQLEVPQLSANLFGNALNGSIKSRGGNKPVLTGEMTAAGPDLTALALAIGALRGIDSDGLSALNAVLGKRRDRDFSFKTTLNADLGADRIALPAVTATFFGNELTGSFSATAATSRQPAIDGELAAQGPDLPALLALIGGLQGAGSVLPGMAASLASAKDKAFTFGTKFALDLKEGRIALPSLGARAMGLILDGSLDATAFNHPAGGLIDGRVTLQGTELAPLWTALGQVALAKSVRTLKFETSLKGSAQTLTMSPFTANLEIMGPNGTAPVDLQLTLGTAEANLQRETLSIKNLALTGLGLNMKGGLEATEFKSGLNYTGQISVPIFNLRQLLATINKPVTNMSDPAALTQVGLEASVQGSAGGYAFNALTLKLDDTTLKGDFAVGTAPGHEVTFNLAVDRLNADRYLAPEGATKAEPLTPEAAAAGAAQLPVETLRKIRVDGKIAVSSLQFAGAQLTNLTVTLQGRDGKLGINPISAALYGGRYTGVIALDATDKAPQLSVNTTLAKVAIEPLLVDMTGKSDLTGTVNFEARLNALGGDSKQMIRSLNGPASFAVTDGLFRGLDVPAVLKATELIIESKSLQPVPQGGTTQFQSLTGSLDIQNGVIYNKDLLLDGLGFKVAGDGMLANLNEMTIKYDARVAVDQGSLEQGAAHYNLGDYVIPIRCRGPLSGTSCVPDFGELAKRAATKAIKDEIEKKLDDSLGGAGKALKNLLKF